MTHPKRGSQNRWWRPWLTCLVLWALIAPPAAASPNVLLIIVDDLRPALGAYGDTYAHTPHIDQLADSGFVFENAFAAVPVCGASRAAMLGGLKPTTRRFLSYDSRLDVDAPDAVSLAAFFKQRGYHTTALGKVFDNEEDSAADWSTPVWDPEPVGWSPVQRDGRRGDLQKAYLAHEGGELGKPYERVDVPDEAYPDGGLALEAAARLARLARDDAPFFMAVGFRKPHLPFNAPERYWARFDERNITLPSTYAESYTATSSVPTQAIHGSFELRMQYAGVPSEGRLPDAEALRLIQGYHASVSYVDAQVGRVLKALEETAAENTVVVLVGDHGWNLGDHTMWTKHNLFEVALRVPLILRGPGISRGRSRSPVSLLDLYPTLAEQATGSVPMGLDGHSLTDHIRGANGVRDRPVHSRWLDGASVRTTRFRYSEWYSDEGAVEARMLFDLKNDPQETINVASAAGYEESVTTLSRSLEEDGARGAWSEALKQIVRFLRGG